MRQYFAPFSVRAAVEGSFEASLAAAASALPPSESRRLPAASSQS